MPVSAHHWTPRGSTFLPSFSTIGRMDDEEYGRRLREARRRAGFKTQEMLGDRIGRSSKMVRNYEAGKHLTPEIKAALEEVLGEFADEGDPVERAIRHSQLIKWRQDDLVSKYEKHVYDQSREEAG